MRCVCYRAWLIDSRGIARKVKNATQFSTNQIKDIGTEANRQCPNCSYRIDNSDVCPNLYFLVPLLTFYLLVIDRSGSSYQNFHLEKVPTWNWPICIPSNMVPCLEKNFHTDMQSSNFYIPHRTTSISPSLQITPTSKHPHS